MNEDKARFFEDMAARIRAQREGEFAGAVLIVPPGDDAEPMDFLGIETRPSAAHFWNATKARIDIAHAEFAERERNGDPFRRR